MVKKSCRSIWEGWIGLKLRQRGMGDEDKEEKIIKQTAEKAETRNKVA